MDQLTHNVRRSNWINIIRQCQDRPAGTTAKQWLALPAKLPTENIPSHTVFQHTEENVLKVQPVNFHRLTKS